MAKDKAEKNTCILYGDIIEYVEGDDALSDAQAAELFRVYLAYANGKEVKISDPEVKGIWRFIKSRVDKDNVKYEEKCEQLRENIKNRYKSKEKATNEYKCNQQATNEYICNNDNDSDNDISPNGDKEKPNAYALGKKKPRPTLDEVKAYAGEKGRPEEAEHFFDFYTANGWKVGKNPMKDWQAAFRNWLKNDFDRGKPKVSEADFYASIAEAERTGFGRL